MDVRPTTATSAPRVRALFRSALPSVAIPESAWRGMGGNGGEVRCAEASRGGAEGDGDGALLGAVAWMAREEGRVAYVMAIAVDVHARGNGIGRALMVAVERTGAKSVALHVHAGNEDAVAFYERLGFHVVEKCPNYYPRLRPSEALYMVKELSLSC